MSSVFGKGGSDGSGSNFEPTKEELEKIGKAMKDPKFRELFAEYAKEISDPENRATYEREITQMEAQQGVDVQFIKPQPGFVVKTELLPQSSTDRNDVRKVFINICSSDVLAEPESRRQKGGMSWSVPNSLSKSREDKDKKGNTCIVYDVVFHPKALRLAVADKRFHDMIVDTAFESIERSFPEHALNREVQKRPKMKFKGTPAATMLRKKMSGDKVESSTANNDAISFPMPYGDPDEETRKHHARAKIERDKIFRKTEREKRKGEVSDPTKSGNNQHNQLSTGFKIPKYTIVHRGEFDMQDYRKAPDAIPGAGRPKQLVIGIELPLCCSTKDVDLDITSNTLSLSCESSGPYKLNINLPYPVDDDNGSAKFDKSKRKLLVTLPVIPSLSPPIESRMLGKVNDSPSTSEEVKNTKYAGGRKPNNTTSDFSPRSPAEAALLVQNDACTMTEDSDAIGASEVPEGGSNDIGNVISIPPSTPHFTYLQTSQIVSVVIEVPEIDSATFSMKFDTVEFGPLITHECTISFDQDKIMGPNAKSFCFFLKFDAALDVDKCSKDISLDNAVVRFAKKVSGQWERMQCGPSRKALQDYRFITSANVHRAERQAELNDEWKSSATQKTNLKVTKKTDQEIITKVNINTDATESGVPTTNKKKGFDHSRIFKYKDDTLKADTKLAKGENTKDAPSNDSNNNNVSSGSEIGNKTDLIVSSHSQSLSDNDFVASERFVGSREGFIYKNGDSGLGYYKDTAPHSIIKKKTKSVNEKHVQWESLPSEKSVSEEEDWVMVGKEDDNFKPSAEFQGSRPGFLYHKRGDRGPGYYKDDFKESLTPEMASSMFISTKNPFEEGGDGTPMAYGTSKENGKGPSTAEEMGLSNSLIFELDD
eukprot:UC4_evm2s73